MKKFTVSIIAASLAFGILTYVAVSANKHTEEVAASSANSSLETLSEVVVQEVEVEVASEAADTEVVSADVVQEVIEPAAIISASDFNQEVDADQSENVKEAASKPDAALSANKQQSANQTTVKEPKPAVSHVSAASTQEGETKQQPAASPKASSPLTSSEAAAIEPTVKKESSKPEATTAPVVQEESKPEAATAPASNTSKTAGVALTNKSASQPKVVATAETDAASSSASGSTSGSSAGSTAPSSAAPTPAAPTPSTPTPSTPTPAAPTAPAPAAPSAGDDEDC